MGACQLSQVSLLTPTHSHVERGGPSHSTPQWASASSLTILPLLPAQTALTDATETGWRERNWWKKAKLMLLVNEVTAAAGFLRNVTTSWF